ncbi:hypothetical protein LIER_43066 [Lithospermum erythrorhizon]|uniref:Uncharacterized protein n=1 Tax=Lithospermum erythrorhizon TaxID=34254 RepID=A0AAV3PF68_LITER
MERHAKLVEKQLFSNTNDTEDEETENLEEEALSLCDLPIKEENRQQDKQTQQENKSIHEEFDFCSFAKESEMCSADQVFFQGQILPLHNSICSTPTNRCLSRSESMSTYSSNGFTSGPSSRSSSIRSHQSSSTTTTTTTTSTFGYGGGSSISTRIHKPRVPNNFNSHSSPKPNMKNSRIKNQNMSNCSKKSTMWSLFRLGLVTTPEIALNDQKHRSKNSANKSFHKSKSFGSNNSENCTRFKPGKNKKQGIFEVNGTLFEGKGTKQQQDGKQSISRNRTFEWLKQLSLESASNVKTDA